MARAQDVLVEGPGVLVGESAVLKPRVGIEGGAVSNIFFDDTDEDLAAVVRLLAGMDIASGARDRFGDDDVGAAAVKFAFGAELQYNEYLSDNPNIRAQRNLDADLHGDVTLNPEGQLSLQAVDRFLRQSRPTNFESSRQLTRDRNHGLVEGRYQPGGRTISIGARYENVLDVFESDESAFANRIQHTFGLNGKWKFFPFSQVWLDASLGVFRPFGEQAVESGYKIASTPLRVLAGVDTSITEATTVKAYGGYARGFYDSGPSFDVPVGGVQLGWRYMPRGRVTLGYAYDVQDSINANYFAEHRIGAEVTQQVARLTLFAGGALHLRGYRGVPEEVAPMSPDRDDTIVSLHARAEFLALERFSLYLDALAESVDTPFRDANGDDPSYFRAEVVGGLTAAF